jgi:hypothetical protein
MFYVLFHYYLQSIQKMNGIIDLLMLGLKKDVTIFCKKSLS